VLPTRGRARSGCLSVAEFDEIAVGIPHPAVLTDGIRLVPGLPDRYAFATRLVGNGGGGRPAVQGEPEMRKIDLGRVYSSVTKTDLRGLPSTALAL
jgi:hypothetical protein